jgi:signal transduction histidine kinase
MLTPFIIKDVKFSPGFSEEPGVLFGLFGGYLVWAVVFSLYRMLVAYRTVSNDRKIQIQYVIGASGMAAIAIASLASWQFLSDSLPLYYVFEVMFSVVIAYAIVKHGAMDIQTVVHRTAMWLAASAVVIIPAGILFSVAFTWFQGQRAPLLGLFVLVCLGILVYARRIQPYIDHYFQRRRYDLYSSLQHLAEELVTLRSINDVSEKVISTVQEVLYTEQAFVTVLSKGEPRATVPPLPGGIPYHRELFAFLLKTNEVLCRPERGPLPEGVPQSVLRYFEQFNVNLVVPFVKDGTLLGVLHLGPKRNLQRYTALDIEYLNRLRTEVTVAYHNSLLFEDVGALTKKLEGWNADLEQKIQVRTQELECAYNQLKEIDQAKTQFFATVSHELRTPLTLILAPLESLLKGEIGTMPSGIQRHVAVMHQNGLRLLKQINNLLDLTKLDAGKMKLQRRPGDLRAFFRGLVASVAPMAEKKRIELTGDEEAPLPKRAYFDPDRLEKVVLNLLFNAIKFSEAGGRVTLRWGRSPEGHLRVQVADTGIGIADKDLPKLFKRFSQVDASTSRRYEGTGIGLALAKEIVELHDGTIAVDSEPGRGSTFTVTIPLLLEAPQDDAAGVEACQESDGAVPADDWTHDLHVAAERNMSGVTAEPTMAAEASLSPANGRQVLIVEDNPDMREFIAFELQGEYRVLKASNGREGVAVAVDGVPDLIISDVMMPEMDGYQLCRAIRGDERTKHIPIILLTARADMAMKIEGLEHGADDYLTKPFNAQELRAKIKSLLELRRLEREIQQRNEALEATLTELKNTQAQLVQSEKMAGLGLLVAGMAHEINNPINFAKNSLSVLQRAWAELKPLLPEGHTPVESVEDIDASLGIVKSGVTRTEEIVSQLKAFVRKDQNQKTECSVREGLESTLGLIRPMVGRGLVVHADLQSTKLVRAIPGKLNQVWMNLLQNAVQAIGATGEIWVESRDHEHTVTVTVRDSGPGIKAEHMARLFEPFFTTKPVGKGTGLGLSVSYQIIQDVGGRIDVRSEPGHGAEFTVVIPAARGLSRAA